VRRGELVTVAMTGDFGKPRPAPVIQYDRFDQTGSVTVLLLSGTLVDAPLIRLTIEPTVENGLRNPSQVMVDKSMTVKRDKLGPPFGRIDDEAMLSVTRSLVVFFGLA
jgi:mRNA interferase MazF